MVVDRNIVIKQEGGKLLFPTIQRKEVDAPAGTPAKLFFMCRIRAYDPESGTMNLKPGTDFVDSRSYSTSIEVNSDVLSSLFIKEVVFVEQHSRYAVAYSTKDRHSLASENEIKEGIRESQTVNLPIELSVKGLRFFDGKVSFDHYMQIPDRKMTFDIVHPFLKKEYDSIKNYFPKALGIDKFSILIQYEYLGNEILNQTCSSSHISMINETLFDQVVDMYISDNLLNSIRDEISTLDEITIELSKKTGSENMQDPNWLLNRLITQERAKHYYHLRYLSDKHLAEKFALRLTSKPLSFIFLLGMQNDYFLIWETYSTEEATYIWRLDNKEVTEPNSKIHKYIDLIKQLRGGNKMTYLRTKPGNFIRIEHEYTGEDLGFKKWKAQLEEFILGNNLKI